MRCCPMAAWMFTPQHELSFAARARSRNPAWLSRRPARRGPSAREAPVNSGHVLERSRHFMPLHRSTPYRRVRIAHEGKLRLICDQRRSLSRDKRALAKNEGRSVAVQRSWPVGSRREGSHERRRSRDVVGACSKQCGVRDGLSKHNPC